MALAEAKTTGGSAVMRRSMSSGTLRKSGEVALKGTGTVHSEGVEYPKLPRYLDVMKLPKKERRKLSESTGNLHGYMARDYGLVNWPLPKMFGEEKYAYSLIDIDDARYVKECAAMSQKLIRLSYDQQIVDLEWRKTYKALLDAENRRDTLPAKAKDTTKALLKKEVDGCKKYLLELQEQKDMYEESIKEIWARCDAIKAELKKESDLEQLRQYMEKQTRDNLHGENSKFWKQKFQFVSANPACRSITGIEGLVEGV